MRTKSPGSLANLIVCGSEDLENLEQIALEADQSIVSVLNHYVEMPRSGGEAFWQHYVHPKAAHPRIKRILDEWIAELRGGVFPSSLS